MCTALGGPFSERFDWRYLLTKPPMSCRSDLQPTALFRYPALQRLLILLAQQTTIFPWAAITFIQRLLRRILAWR